MLKFSAWPGHGPWVARPVQGSSVPQYIMLTMLERATRSFGTTRVMSNVAFTAGSSQHGNARRASVGCKTMGTTKQIYSTKKPTHHTSNHPIVTTWLAWASAFSRILNTFNTTQNYPSVQIRHLAIRPDLSVAKYFISRPLRYIIYHIKITAV